MLYIKIQNQKYRQEGLNRLIFPKHFCMSRPPTIIAPLTHTHNTKYSTKTDRHKMLLKVCVAYITKKNCPESKKFFVVKRVFVKSIVIIHVIHNKNTLIYT